jgi:hypothetical protein
VGRNKLGIFLYPRAGMCVLQHGLTIVRMGNFMPLRIKAVAKPVKLMPGILLPDVTDSPD